MTMKKRLFSVFFTLLLTFTCAIPSVFASEYSNIRQSNEGIVFLQDGSYIISTIQENSCISLYATTHTKSGSKTSTVYSASGSPLYSITVHGVFSYNGSSASATSASYSYTDESPLWSFSNGSSSFSGATATASGTFKSGQITKTIRAVLSCSANGMLS